VSRAAGVARAALIAAIAMVGVSDLACVRAGGKPASLTQAAAGVDSATVALWRFDEATGVRCADSGPMHLDGTAGPGTRASYGRFASAREFTRVMDSFVYVPYDQTMDRTGSLTVEAWVYVQSYGDYDVTPIVARWTQEGNQQSWWLGIVGRRLLFGSPSAPLGSVPSGQAGQLVFEFQPDEAGPPRAFASTQRVALQRWTHVAATLDGSVVRFFIDGRLDAQYATRGHIQASAAPMLVGNYFDTRQLTSFGGELRVNPVGDATATYAFEGSIDELRLSSVARGEFPGTGAR